MNLHLRQSVVSIHSCLVLMLSLSGWLLPGTIAAAQTHRALIVVVRTAQGSAAPGISIHIRDQTGARNLADGVTDATGRAYFPNLAVDVVRVVAAGTLPSGVRLFQRGLDGSGIWIELNASHGTLDLLIERDGAVVPDPSSMMRSTVMDAALSSQAIAPGAAVASIAQSLPAPADHPPLWLPAGLLALAGIIGVALLMRGGR